ncbi:unnamed protein product [Musa acuminata subsp. burmannicoides]
MSTGLCCPSPSPTRVRFGALALWLPLLCYASNGVTSPVLMAVKRWEMERVMEDLIAGLPGEDQEIILRYWLEDFAASDSDWPNLSRFLNVNTKVKISVSMSKLSTYGVVDAIYTFSKYKTKRNTIAL